MNIYVWFDIPIFNRNITLHKLLTSPTVKVLMERKKHIIEPSGALLISNPPPKLKKTSQKIAFISANGTF